MIRLPACDFRNAWRRATRTVLVWLAVCCLPPVSAWAQRELHWERLEVIAHLNADGTLSVTETQTIVFTGDWNGGERTFNIRPRQQFAFANLARLGPGGWQSLTEDSSLDDLDEFAWTDTRTLRWRSRLPSDPPFAATPIRYELAYALTGILTKEGDRYRLDHDFAFPDRAGRIEHFELRLTLDPAWQPLSDVRPLYTAGPLQAGTSFVLELPLQYTGTGVPAAIDLTRPPAIRNAVGVTLGVTLVALLWFFQREHRSGRFTPLPGNVDEAWVREHILKYPAEVVAAAWDEKVGPPEVVALISRMVGDGTLESAVGGKGKHASLTLRLKVDRETLAGHERALVDSLFFDGRTETSTSAVRAHYRTKGFDPADAIRRDLRAAVDRVLPDGARPRRFWIVSGALFAIGTGLLGIGWFQSLPAVFALAVAMVVLAGLGQLTGLQFRSYLDRGHRAAWVALAPALVIALVVTGYLWFYATFSDVELNWGTIVGLVALALSCILSSIEAARSRRSRQAIAFRKALTAGRDFFRAELQKPRPALRDDWYPWLLGLELGKHVDDWSTARAGAGARTSSGATSFDSSHTTSSSAGSAWTGFTGGRSGGAGASASWQAAASGMAASVAAPSSSGSSGGSSGGGSSGGGSSGGGGGGGW